MQCYVLNHKISTYFNIADVEKNPNATSKRALNQTLKAECIVVLKPSSGSLEFSTSHKEKRKSIWNLNCLQNQYATSSNVKQTQTPKRTVLPCP